MGPWPHARACPTHRSPPMPPVDSSNDGGPPVRSRRSSGVGGVAESWLYTNVFPFPENYSASRSLRLTTLPSASRSLRLTTLPFPGTLFHIVSTLPLHTSRQVPLIRTFVTAMGMRAESLLVLCARPAVCSEGRLPTQSVALAVPCPALALHPRPRQHGGVFCAACATSSCLRARLPRAGLWHRLAGEP